MWVFLTKITAKLILNVAYHGWEKKKIFYSRSPKAALNSIFLPFYLTEKANCMKELCQKSFENILHDIMWNSAYMQEKIISGSIKTLQIRLLPLSAAMLFTLGSVSHVKNSTHRKTKFSLLLNMFLIATRQLNLQQEQWRSHSIID